MNKVLCIFSTLPVLILACGSEPGNVRSVSSAQTGAGLTCDVHDYGAKGDGTTKDTAAIQGAIDDCSSSGGTVVLKGGTFLSGTIQLKSGVVFDVDTSATLMGTQDDTDYPTLNPPTTNTQLSNCRKALVYAESANGIRITGGGTINGNGNKPEWTGSSKQSPEYTRPMAVFTVLSQNVTIENVTVKESAMWSVVNMEADNLVIRNVTVNSTIGGTRDGIDVVDCHHVLVDNVNVTSEDDSICLKSGSTKGVYDVTVQNSHVHQSSVANGLKFGTASYGSLSKVLFDTITVEDTDKAAMALEAVDGSVITDVTFRNIQFKNVGTPIFLLLGDRGSTPTGGVHQVGNIDGVTFENISGSGVKYPWGSIISGTVTPDGVDHHIKNVSFTNVQFTAKGGLTSIPSDPPEYAGQYPDPNLWGNVPAYGFFIRHAFNITFDGSTPDVSPDDARQPFVMDDTKNVTVR